MAKRNIPAYGNRGGRGSGMDMGKLMQQAKKMQDALEAAQEKAKLIETSASAGGGMVKVVVSGDLELRSLEIDPEALDPDDVELLQDMIIAAVNDALRAASDAANQEVASATGIGGVAGQDPLADLGLGGLF